MGMPAENAPVDTNTNPNTDTGVIGDDTVTVSGTNRSSQDRHVEDDTGAEGDDTITQHESER